MQNIYNLNKLKTFIPLLEDLISFEEFKSSRMLSHIIVF